MAKLLTPGLLRVIPMGSAIKVAGTLAKNQKRAQPWLELVESLSQVLERAKMDCAVSIERSTDADTGVDIRDREACQRVLELYFFQIQTRKTWILDFRSSAFARRSALNRNLCWRPQSLFYEMDPGFAQGLAELYQGHYLGDEACFSEGLKRLGISNAREVIRRHFGSGDLSAYRFELGTFQTTFADIIHRCSEEGIRLDPQFLVLGVMLVGLYQNLESFDAPLDVRGAYIRAFEASQQLARNPK